MQTQHHYSTPSQTTFLKTRTKHDSTRKNTRHTIRRHGRSPFRISNIAKSKAPDFSPPNRVGADEPFDLYIGRDAIDTKYRIGSGDSGTLKKFKAYGKWATENNLEPIFLILREDNLPAALSACYAGGWTVKTGHDTFTYIEEKTGFDLQNFLQEHKGYISLNRI